MQQFSSSQYPFLDFFYALQEEQDGQKLDTSNYLLMLEAMQKGFGLARKQDLLDVCKTLWLKPGFSEKRFEQLFYDADTIHPHSYREADQRRAGSPHPVCSLSP